MMYGFGNYGPGMGMGLNMLFMALIWILVIIAIIWFVKAIFGQDHRQARHESVEDILKKRYARGEISKEEFERLQQELLQ